MAHAVGGLNRQLLASLPCRYSSALSCTCLQVFRTLDQVHRSRLQRANERARVLPGPILGRAPLALLLAGGHSAGGTRRSVLQFTSRVTSECVACALASENVLLDTLGNLDDVADVSTELAARGLLISSLSVSRERFRARLEYPNRLQEREHALCSGSLLIGAGEGVACACRDSSVKRGSVRTEGADAGFIDRCSKSRRGKDVERAGYSDGSARSGRRGHTLASKWKWLWNRQKLWKRGWYNWGW